MSAHPFQNVVSLEAIKITPNQNIDTISPGVGKRECYFDYEYPLKSQNKYSYVSKYDDMDFWSSFIR